MLTCAFENGATTSLRHVVVDAIVANDNHEILLIKRAPHLVNGDKYALPGGYLDRDETAQQAVVREVLEETGYSCTIESLFCINDNPNRPQEDRQNIAFIYIVKPIKKEREPDHESTEVEWFNLNKLPAIETFAFDHYNIIKKYLVHKTEFFVLPIILTTQT